MRILLAEDELELADALGVILKHNNYSVETVDNGTDALAYLLSGGYDCAILDVMMPGKDGIAVLREYRSAGGEIPVLILTAKSEIEDKVRGLDSGADDYLTKPFATKELLARLRALTRRRSGSAENVLRMGNLKLDLSTCELSAEKGAFRLANKEFQIMEMLMANPNMLISTERFMERIWGLDSETEISVVWVYISYLRKKLNAVGANVAIKAVRGVGYTLEEKQ